MTQRNLRRWLLGLIVSAVGFSASADALVGDIYYSFNAANKTAQVESKAYGIMEFYSGDVVVPATVDYQGVTYTVTSIGQFAFSDYDADLTSVTLPNTITKLDSYAFDSTVLTELTLPESVETIGSAAFEYSELEKITFGSNLKSMDGDCFKNCNSLSEVTVGAITPPTIAATTFPTTIRGNLTLIVPQSSIDAYKASANWSGFKAYQPLASGPEPLPATVQVEKDGIYYMLTTADKTAQVMTSYKLVENKVITQNYSGDINIPSTVQYEGEDYTVTSLEDECFYECTPTSLTLPETLTKVGWESFYGLKTPESLVIPDKVAVIEHGDFYAARFKEITLGSGVTKIETEAFHYVNLLTTLTVNAEVPPTLDANAFNGNIKANTTLWVPKGTVAAYKAAANWSGFKEYKEIGVVEESNHVLIDGIWYRLGTATYNPEASLGTKICSVDAPVESGFSNGDEYSGEINVPAFITYRDQRYAVTAVAWYAFRDQAGVTAVNLPETITTIGSAAFKGTAITSLILPENVNTLDNNAFLGCSQLTELTSLNPVPPTAQSATFPANVTSKATLYVPAGKVDTYKAAQYWSNFSKIEVSSLSPIRPEQITLSRTSTSAIVGETIQLTYEILPADATDKTVEWKSLNTAVATVDANGLVTVKGEGRANIEVICNGDRTISAMCNVLGLPKEKEIDGINYRFVHDEAAKVSEAYVIRKTTANYAGNVVIPSTLNVGVNFIVSGIDGNAFALMKEVTSVTIPSTVKSIGFNAFRLCDGLKEVNITDLNAWANIDFTDKLANPINCAGTLLVNGTPVTAISISGSAGQVKPFVFQGLETLTSLSIGDGVTKIGKSAFEGCSALKAVVLPESVETIEMAAFQNCSQLASINFPSKLTTISTGMVQGTALTEVVLPEGVEIIDNQAFMNIATLKSITLPSTLDMIYMKVFAGCPLETIVCDATTPPAFFQAAGFGDYALSFDTSIFSTCKLLVPAETVNAYKAAPGWKNFINIKANLPAEETAEVTIDGFNYRLYLDSKTAELLYSTTYTGSVEIPAEVKYQNNNYSVTAIGEGAFDGLVNVTGITLPESVATIGKRAFAGTGVDVMSIPQAVLEIPQEMMADCKNLISLALPDKFETIGIRAFFGDTKLRYIFCNNLGFGANHVPPTFTTYEGDPTNYGEAFSPEIWPDCMLVIPADMFANYKGANGWKNFRSWAYWHNYDVMPETFELTPDDVTLDEGKPVTLVPTFTPANALPIKYIIASIDTNIATVEGKVVDEKTQFEVSYVADGETTLVIYCGLLKAECKIICKKGSGVNEISVEDADVRWFNLNGLEVKDPTPGEVMIRVKGNKSEKVIVR
ncbi:MAG: leucine-rich repeat protein [Muribaculaceae bacterium]|nr:leucine-rich repeat protein [Muribaculaceae bacterium]